MKLSNLSIIFASILIANNPFNAFSQRSCGHTHMMQNEINKHPQTSQRIAELEQYTKNYIANKKNNRTTATTYTIPVVVHVVYNTSDQNISDNQIQSQIDSLNKDYQLANNNFKNTPSEFKSVAGNANFVFKLASIDPNGLPTTGITRTFTNTTKFGFSDNMKYSSSGGKDAWNPDEYINIWICNLDQVLGFAYAPGIGDKSKDGVVIAYDCFGTIGNLRTNFKLGRTATHEIGHYFNLIHIWGDGTNCKGDDQVNDTPQHEDANYGCKSYPYKPCSSTTTTSEMFMNYMDYSDDNCMTMFSQGQVDRMTAALKGARSKLLTSPGLGAAVQSNNDVSIVLTSQYYQGIQIQNPFTAKVNLINLGKNTINSAVLVLKDSLKNIIYTQNWSGTLTSKQSEIVNFNCNNTLPLGVIKLSIECTSINSGADENISNNKIPLIVSNVGTEKIPYSLDFENYSGNNLSFPPINCGLENPDNNISWAIAKTGAKGSTRSMVMRNYDCLDLNGQKDVFITPYITISTKATLKFDYAYKFYSSTLDFGDTLKIYASTNQGLTKDLIWAKGGADLAKSNTAFTTSDFVPSSNNWFTENINLDAYSGKTINLYFEEITDYENNLYIDNILINSDPLTANDYQINQPTLYPNPTNDKLFLNSVNQLMKAEISTIDGNKIKEHNLENTNEINVSELDYGLYFIKIYTIGQTYISKFVKH